MKLEKFTKRKSPATGKPYPRCQFESDGAQCDKPVYEEGYCWSHYRKDAPSITSNHHTSSRRRGDK